MPRHKILGSFEPKTRPVIIRVRQREDKTDIIRQPVERFQNFRQLVSRCAGVKGCGVKGNENIFTVKFIIQRLFQVIARQQLVSRFRYSNCRRPKFKNVLRIFTELAHTGSRFSICYKVQMRHLCEAVPERFIIGALCCVTPRNMCNRDPCNKRCLRRSNDLRKRSPTMITISGFRQPNASAKPITPSPIDFAIPTALSDERSISIF